MTEPIQVAVIGPVKTVPDGRPADIPECGFSPITRVSTGDQTSPLLAHVPKRTRATLTFTGTNAGDSCYLCGSSSDAQKQQGALITTDGQKTHPPIVLAGTGEIWLAPGQGSVSVGVISEVRSMP